MPRAKKDFIPNAYEPLLATGFVSVIAAEVLHLTYALPFFPIFLGLWLVQFGMVKLFDIDAFAAKFVQYDPVAGNSRVYAYLYPFIQIALGAAYLGVYYPQWISVALVVIATVNLIGLYRHYDNNKVFKDVTLSGLLRTPLRGEAIIENTLMTVMALAYLLTHKFIW